MPVSLSHTYLFNNPVIVLRPLKLPQKSRGIFEVDEDQDEGDEDEGLPAMTPERYFEQQL